MPNEPVAALKVANNKFEASTNRLRALVDAIKELSWTHLQVDRNSLQEDSSWYAYDLHGKAISAGSLAEMALDLIDNELYEARFAVTEAAKGTSAA